MYYSSLTLRVRINLSMQNDHFRRNEFRPTFMSDRREFADDDLDDDEYPDDDYTDDDDEADTRECPRCGADNYEDALQCTLCGHYLSSETGVWSGRSWWWMALGALGIIATIVLLSWPF